MKTFYFKKIFCQFWIFTPYFYYVIECVLAIRRCGKLCCILDIKDQYTTLGFPGGAVVKNPPATAGDTGSSPGPGRSHMLWNN